jgi:DNA-binding SARP family transcriptional activator
MRPENYRLQLFLFGRFEAQWDGEPLRGLDGQKPQELLCYLLIHRDRYHFRERLAELLWENSSSSQSKQYLRRVLWQIQSALEAELGSATGLIRVDADWLQIDAEMGYWCDATQFEAVFRLARNVKGRELTAAQAQSLEQAIDLYHGDLLESWYQDWCIMERERFQNMYLMILDKLMSYCEASRQFERGIHFGVRVLRCDVARERTYRHLIRMSYHAGDRTGALRWYGRCATVLEDEFGVKPGKLTTALYEQIKRDGPVTPMSTQDNAGPGASLGELLDRLELVQQEIESIKLLLSSRH